jgi:tryptophan 2,3-dioxygenase
LPELLSLQNGVKAGWTEIGKQPTAVMESEHINADENMFIIVHQCFEIWFKAALDHIDRAIPLIMQGDITVATGLLRHVLLVQRLLVQQIQIPATMLPLDFLRFRARKMERDGKVFVTGLSPASGTESYQFREIEIVCGLRDDPVFRKYLAGNEILPIRLLTPRQAERLRQPALLDALRHAVQGRGLSRFDDIFTVADAPNPNADLAELADTMLEFDEFFRFWRLGHVSMVEKMIGAKSGTGFLGPEYLMETAGIKIQEKNRVFEERQLRPRFFEELWAVRTRMSG